MAEGRICNAYLVSGPFVILGHESEEREQRKIEISLMEKIGFQRLLLSGQLLTVLSHKLRHLKHDHRIFHRLSGQMESSGWPHSRDVSFRGWPWSSEALLAGSGFLNYHACKITVLCGRSESSASKPGTMTVKAALTEIVWDILYRYK